MGGPPEGRSGVPAGKSWFFGIGIDNYLDDRIPNLNYAVRDMEAVYERLLKDYDLEEDTHYHLLLRNDQATKRAIIKAFNTIGEKVQDRDKVLIYFAGHGAIIGGDGYWKPYDAEEGHEDTLIINDYLRKLIGRLQKARHVLVLMDSCYSGSFLAETTRSGTPSPDRLEEEPSRYAICSGGPKDAVLDKSPFAQYLLEQLDKHPEEWLDSQALAVRVRNLTLANFQQKPQFGIIYETGDKGGAYLFRKKTAEEAFWKSCLARNNLSAFSDYLKRYPQGKYAAEALEHIRDLEDEREWQRAVQRNLVYAYHQYLSRFPDGKYVKEAHERIHALESESDFPPPPTPKPKPKPAPITFTDPRDGQVYKTIELNGRTWMAQNLNYDVGEGCWVYDNDPKNGEKYGRLYTWKAAQKACPPGWRLPTDDEWRAMAKVFGGCDDDANDGGKAANDALIEGGSSGFSARLGGYRLFDGDFGLLGSWGEYWSATERGSDRAWYYTFVGGGKLRRSLLGKSNGFSCRCLQD